MRSVLELAFGLTGSWGESLLLLSLVVNIVLIPFYHLAESWQEAERAVQRAMAPKLAEINSVYRGRERYMLTRALHRLHGYTPIMSLRTSAGLLIQIPFFFAAFHLLNEAPELRGTSFVFIRDLAEPDSLLSLGGLTVNALPFAMTGVNLLSAAVYASRLTRREKVQLYGLAALFLVLLYTSSAALLVYWTCNNIFSFFKNIVYHRFIYADSHFRKERAERARNSSGQPVDGAPLRSRVFRAGAALPGWADCAPGLTGIAAFLVSIYLAKRYGVTAPVTLAVTTLAALTGLLALGLRCLRLAALERTERCFPLLYLLVAFVICLSVWQLTPLKKLASPASWAHTRLYAVALGALCGWLFGQWPLHPLFRRAAGFCERTLPSWAAPSLFSAGILLAAVIVCWYSPAQLYASDPDFFYEPLSQLMAGVTLRGLLFLIAAALLFRLTSGSLRSFMAVAAVWLGLCAFAYTFVAAGDYGTMDGFTLQEPSLLRSRLAGLVDPLVTAGSGGLLWLLLRAGKGKALAGLAQGACIAVFCLGIHQLWIAPDKQTELSDDEISARLPAYTERLFSLSKSEKNVVVLMLDMFTGGHVKLILDEEPELAAKFDGFTWYPDTVSAGATTLLSLPSIMGGVEYSPEAINARKPDSLHGEIQKGFAVLPNVFIPLGYDVAFAGLDELIPSLFEEACPRVGQMLLVGRAIETAYTPYWRSRMGLPSPLPETQAPFLASVGLFHAAPWLLRRHIYDNGAWMNTQTVVLNHSEGSMAMLHLFPELFNSGAAGPTLKVVASQVAHYPWRLDDRTCMPVAGSGNTRRKDNVIVEHLATERCALRALARWVDSLKKAGVYDNTQIILVSDHDGNDNLLGREYDDMRIKNIPWKPHALLMVKGMGERGLLRVDHSLMSSTDVIAFICRDNGPCPEIPGLNREILDGAGTPGGRELTGRVRIHNAGLASIRRHKKDRFIVNTYRVDGSMFQRENWSQMQERGK